MSPDKNFVLSTDNQSKKKNFYFPLKFTFKSPKLKNQEKILRKETSQN